MHDPTPQLYLPVHLYILTRYLSYLYIRIIHNGSR
jgi:hypothetical protein